MRRYFDEGSKVKVIVNGTLEELEQEVVEFISDKIVIDIQYGFIEDPRSHRMVVIYKETPDFSEWEEEEVLEVEDVELETMRDIYIAFNEGDDM